MPDVKFHSVVTVTEVDQYRNETAVTVERGRRFSISEDGSLVVFDAADRPHAAWAKGRWTQVRNVLKEVPGA